MPIEIPAGPGEVVTRSQTGVQRELPAANPFLRNSFIRAITTSFGLRLYDFYLQLRILADQVFPQTAALDFLRRWGSLFGVTENAATGATGTALVGGTIGSDIPAGTLWVGPTGVLYATTAATAIGRRVSAVSQVSKSGTTATAITASSHGLATGATVTVSGADQSAFNGQFVVAVTAADAFTYVVPATAPSAATGTISVAIDGALLSLSSRDTSPPTVGVNTNLVSGSPLTIRQSIAGVDTAARATFGGLAGGADDEAEGPYRSRVVDRIRNPVAMFNEAAIVNAARSVAGVTRVFVRSTTPAVGQVTVHFVRDNDDNIIPSAPAVAEVRAAILELLPVQSDSADVIVSAPLPVPIAFTFSALSPATATMRQAVDTSLAAFFTGVDHAEDVTVDQYRSAIQNTVDRVTGDGVAAFTLTSPTAGVTIPEGSIAVYGGSTFA